MSSVLENDTHKFSGIFAIKADIIISARRPDLVIIKKKKQKESNLVSCRLCRSCWPQLKESKKTYKNRDLARELKKLWNMKVTVKSFVIGALGTVTKGLVQRLKNLEIRGWVVTIQTVALLRSARILRKVLDNWGDLLSLRFQWKNRPNT